MRRFFVRPRWLGEKVSIESGVIAGLIFLLMVSYLAAFMLPADSAALKAWWWVHTLTLLAFLPIIPGTKHLHLVLSPLTVFLKRDGFSDIPKLNESETEEDFGLLAGKDLTQIIALQAYSCVECGRCTEHCPAANTGKVLNPKEIALGVREYLKEFGPASDRPLLNELREGRRILRILRRIILRRTGCRWRRRLSARRAGRASFSARWACSICRSSLGCGAAR